MDLKFSDLCDLETFKYKRKRVDDKSTLFYIDPKGHLYIQNGLIYLPPFKESCNAFNAFQSPLAANLA